MLIVRAEVASESSNTRDVSSVISSWDLDSKNAEPKRPGSRSAAHDSSNASQRQPDSILTSILPIIPSNAGALPEEQKKAWHALVHEIVSSNSELQALQEQVMLLTQKITSTAANVEVLDSRVHLLGKRESQTSNSVQQEVELETLREQLTKLFEERCSALQEDSSRSFEALEQMQTKLDALVNEERWADVKATFRGALQITSTKLSMTETATIAPMSPLADFHGQDLQQGTMDEHINTLPEAKGGREKLEDTSAEFRPYLQKDCDEENENIYQIQESVWDATLLVGFPCITLPTSLLLIMSALSAATVQMGICIVIYLTFGSGDGFFDDSWKHWLEHWRVWTGHFAFYVDSQTQKTLVRRICEQHPSEFQSALQYDMYGDVSEFLNLDSERELLSFVNGVTLSYIAVLCWVCLVWDDLYTISAVVGAVANFPRGAPRISCGDGDALYIHSYSNIQLISVSVIMFLPRVVITLFLGWSGMWFLGQCSNIGDLLLNTTALSFVLDLDEVFFLLFIPNRIKAMISKFPPFEYQPSQIAEFMRGKLGKDVVVWLNITIVFAIMCITRYTILNPFHESLTDVAKILCGGNKDFIYTVEGNGSLIIADTQPFNYGYTHSPQISSLLAYVFDENVAADSIAEVVPFDTLMATR